MEGAVEVHVGVGEEVVITGRTAEVRDVAERRAEGGEHHFFTAGQAIEQGQGEGIAFDRRQGIAATAADQPLDHVLGVDQAEVFNLVDEFGGNGEVRVIEPHRRDAIAAITLGRDLAGTGATHHTHTAKALLQGLAECLEVVGSGTEKQHEPQVRMQQLPRQLLGRLPGIGGLGHGTDYAFTVVHRWFPL